MNLDALRDIICQRGKTQKEVAEMLGISEKTFGRRMKDGNFRSEELQMLIHALSIQDPATIFFTR